MTDAVSDFLIGTATPAAFALSAIALIITSFARGWLMSRFAVETLLKSYELLVEQANKRADDWKELYETEKKRADTLSEIAERQVVQGETLGKLLAAIPHVGAGEKSP